MILVSQATLKVTKLDTGCQKGSNVVTGVNDLEPYAIGIFDDGVLEALDMVLAQLVPKGIKAIISPHDGNAFGFNRYFYALVYSLPFTLSTASRQKLKICHEKCIEIHRYVCLHSRSVTCLYTNTPGKAMLLTFISCDLYCSTYGDGQKSSNSAAGYYQSTTAKAQIDARYNHILNFVSPSSGKKWGQWKEAILAFDIENEPFQQAQSLASQNDPPDWLCNDSLHHMPHPYRKDPN